MLPLSVDGRTTQVSTRAGTVSDVLHAEGVRIGDHDAVAPGPDAPIEDGTRLAVRLGGVLPRSGFPADL